MADHVVFTDVGPRDGLQNQPKILTVDERLSLVAAIAAAGVSSIEVGSFVSPKAVPAMANTDELVSRLPTDDGVHYSALIPNMKGYELARDAGVRTVNMVLYASEGMAQKNVNMSVAEAEEATGRILERAAEDGVSVVAAIATSFCCPFDGPTDPGVVRDIVDRFIDSGIEQLVLADTIGAANPAEVRTLTRDLVADHGADRIGCHFHDTRAMGIANIFAALESGIYRSDLAEELTGTAPGGRAKAWLKPWLAKRAG
jgi:hydroxymethylglutaryl-CoA lyase